ncbi:MAG: P-II family nitrogen regulator [Candidatus Latescibacteria bacterium]|nr:P-II family nitrogen regulator [Candidatus Latescibacterota bacterium]
MPQSAPTEPLEMITIIVQRGMGNAVAKAAIEAGAQASTIYFARGTGIRERLKFFGIAIHPEKEVIFTIVPQSIADNVYNAMAKTGKLNEPGMGFIFAQDVRKATGWISEDLKTVM